MATEVERLSLEEYRALPPAERRRQWIATWSPAHWSVGYVRAWNHLLTALADGEWHSPNDIRPGMMDAGDIHWKGTYFLIHFGTLAGGLQEYRPDGSRLMVDRLIRLSDDIPARLARVIES